MPTRSARSTQARMTTSPSPSPWASCWRESARPYAVSTISHPRKGKSLRHSWSNNHQAGLASLRVFMGTLRKKIEPDPVHPRNIQTHISVGYRMMRVTDE